MRLRKGLHVCVAVPVRILSKFSVFLETFLLLIVRKRNPCVWLTCAESHGNADSGSHGCPWACGLQLWHWGVAEAAFKGFKGATLDGSVFLGVARRPRDALSCDILRPESAATAVVHAVLAHPFTALITRGLWRECTCCIGHLSFYHVFSALLSVRCWWSVSRSLRMFRDMFK